MPILPIDNRMSIMNTQDAGRIRDGQMRHEEGQNRLEQQNLINQERLEQMTRPTLEIEKKGIEQQDEKEQPQGQHKGRSADDKDEENEKSALPPPSDGIRGLNLDIVC